ncbi:hypothetical protein D3C80_1803470 [compost metagenome]
MPYFMLAQMTRHQFNGFTGPHQQDVQFGKGFEYLACQGTGGKGHGYRTGADFGFGTYAFGDGEGFLEQALKLTRQ